MFRRGVTLWAAAGKKKVFQPASSISTFMLLDIGGQSELRLEFELFAKKAPMAAENFAKLCSGEAVLPYQAPSEVIADPGFKDQYLPQLTYVGSTFHRVVKDFIVQGGDITADGETTASAFGPSFEAPGELSAVPFNKAGLIGTAVSSPGSNTSEFFILTAAKGAPHLDGSCICFGKVSKGYKELMAIVASLDLNCEGEPATPIRVIDAGII